MQQNLPECSVQRRHYITELKYKQSEVECPPYLDKVVLGFILILIIAVFI